jgi:hypothetical protein
MISPTSPLENIVRSEAATKRCGLLPAAGAAAEQFAEFSPFIFLGGLTFAEYPVI